MTKADKIKICLDFMKGTSIYGTWYFRQCKGQYCSVRNVEKAIRWGVKYPEELRKEKNETKHLASLVGWVGKDVEIINHHPTSMEVLVYDKKGFKKDWPKEWWPPKKVRVIVEEWRHNETSY